METRHGGVGGGNASRIAPGQTLSTVPLGGIAPGCGTRAVNVGARPDGAPS